MFMMVLIPSRQDVFCRGNFGGSSFENSTKSMSLRALMTYAFRQEIGSSYSSLTGLDSIVFGSTNNIEFVLRGQVTAQQVWR